MKKVIILAMAAIMLVTTGCTTNNNLYNKVRQKHNETQLKKVELTQDNLMTIEVINKIKKG